MLRTQRCTTGSVLVAITMASRLVAVQVDLTPTSNRGDVVRVAVELEAGGDTLVRPEKDDAGSVGPEERITTKATAKLAYKERRLGRPGSSQDGTQLLAVRYYESADASIQVGERMVASTLSDAHRLVVVEAGASRPFLYSPGGPLTRNELDLVDVIGNTASIDGLLPTKPVADGATWRIDAAAMAAVLALDSIAVCEVECVLEEYNGRFAKVRLAGVVHGTIDGAATQQDVKGIFLVDREVRRITRLNLAIREQRSIGSATPGLEAVAKLQITINPAENAPQLADNKADGFTVPVEERTTDLMCDIPTMGFRIAYDRNWFVTSQQRESITLRRVEGDDLVAQCTLAMLPAKSADNQTSLEQFQRDIKYSLGPSFGQVVSSRQWQNSHGHYCYEVVSRGTTEGVPVEWHHFLIARDGGHRITATVTMEGSRAASVAGIDRALIERLQLYPPLPAATARVADSIAK